MDIDKTLTDLGATKNADLFGTAVYVLKTKTGLLYIQLNDNHLTCNFIGSESKAKAKFGHWKQNIFIEDESDVITHINWLKN